MTITEQNMNTNENPLKSFIIFKNLWKYIKIHQTHSKFTKINENPKSFSYERCNLNQVISQIKIPLKHALNVISCDFCPQGSSADFFRWNMKKPPANFQKTPIAELVQLLCVKFKICETPYKARKRHFCVFDNKPFFLVI